MQPRKDQVRKQVAGCFRGANNEDELKLALGEMGLSFYQRGKSLGVIEKANGRRYRLKTLGVLAELEHKR